MRALIRMAGVGKQYPSGSEVAFAARLLRRKRDSPWALASVDLEVMAGESVALIGRNGSGKSTLLGIAAGTIAPTAGHVERRVDPTLLFTIGTSFDEELSGSENARLELLLRGLRGPALQTGLAEAREFSEIEDAWDEPLRTYSSGMRARVAMAAALAAPGPLLLVDEILAVGDAGFIAKCISHFRVLRQAGTSLVFVSHDPHLAEALADEALVLDHGRVVAQGSLADAFAAYAEVAGLPAPEPS